MKVNRSLLLAAALCALCASAQSTQDAKASARARMKEALTQSAPLPTERPSLPDTASQQARDVHGTIAFGQKGATQKAAKSEAAERSAAASQASARGAARAAAAKANADARSATGQSKSKKPVNPGRPDSTGKP
jgi:hypothetical protein